MDAARDPLGRLERRAAHLPLHLRGRNVPALAVRAVRRFIDVRVTGLAAEMTYYTVLSLVPLLAGLGAALGLVERIAGRQAALGLEEALIDGVAGVLSAELVDDVVAPLIRELLQQERAGLAVGSLVLSLWLAGRAFRAAIRALDDAYAVEERRTLAQQWVLSVAFTAGALLLVTVTLSLLVIGPLLGGGRAIADWVGLGGAFEVAWAVGRWPFLAATSVSFLTVLYLAGPNVDDSWRHCIPGALAASVALVLVVVGFRLYLEVAGPTMPEVTSGNDAVVVAAQLLGVLAAALLLIWLSNIAVLLGGVVNAEWVDAAPAHHH